MADNNVSQEETMQERSARLRIEYSALRFDAKKSLRCRLERILAAGGWYDDDGNTIEKALVQYAGIMTKAVAIAMMAEGNELDTETGIDSSSLLGVDAAARALFGISALLTEGVGLLHELELADQGAT